MYQPNLTDKSANITLSGTGSLVATASVGGTIIGARGSQGRGAVGAGVRGLFVFEVKINAIGASNKISFGLATTGASLATEAGNDTLSVGYRTSDHRIEAINSGTLITPDWAAPVANDIVTIELDNLSSSTISTVKFYKNGVENSVSVSGITITPLCPFVTLFDLNDQVTVSFGGVLASAGGNTVVGPLVYGYTSTHSPWIADSRPNHPTPRSKVQYQHPIHHIRL